MVLLIGILKWLVDWWPYWIFKLPLFIDHNAAIRRSGRNGFFAQLKKQTSFGESECFLIIW